VQCVDLNNDGKKDLILGNKGTNTSYKATAKNPMRLFVNDFDSNGTIEQITTRTIDEKDMPINLKQELAKQIPSIKKKNLSYSDYAKKTIQEIFAPEVISNSLQKTAVLQESIIAINKGKGQFEFQILPQEVQLSTINTSCVLDINKDGNLDIILGGNQYEFKPQFGRLDASHGNVLLGNKKGKFSLLPFQKSGLFLTGEVQKMRAIKTKNKPASFVTGIFLSLIRSFV
jgi:hypothetical protein